MYKTYWIWSMERFPRIRWALRKLQIDTMSKFYSHRVSDDATCGGFHLDRCYSQLHVLYSQRIHDCVTPFESRYALVCGQIRRDSNRKDSRPICKLVLVVLMQVLDQHVALISIFFQSIRFLSAGLVIDGSIAYPFNDGAKILLEVHPEDALLTVNLDET